ncbi:MAG TPA: hypothetical protein VGT82_00355, partial [Ktedonobacteraceae bacterium]|nr:hypothetical protein [Ktedonobacteraceae bacterium]
MPMFPQGDPTTRPQQHRTGKTLRIATLLLLLVTLVVAAVSVISARGTYNAHAASAWTPVWSDNFDGAAGTGLDTNTWRYDTGTGWGTGEIENMTNSTANVQQDGSGHLKITAI